MIDTINSMTAWILSGSDSAYLAVFTLAIFIVLPLVNIVDKTRERATLRKTREGYAQVAYRLGGRNY